jgi:hypothetical protein
MIRGGTRRPLIRVVGTIGRRWWGYYLRGEVGVGVLRGAGVELLDDGGAAVAERGVVDAAVRALADEGAVAEVVGDLLELVEGYGRHVDADGLGGPPSPGRARAPRPASVACIIHGFRRRRWWSDIRDAIELIDRGPVRALREHGRLRCADDVLLNRTGGVGIGWWSRLIGRRAVAVLLGASAARHFWFLPSSSSPDWTTTMRGVDLGAVSRSCRTTWIVRHFFCPSITARLDR